MSWSNGAPWFVNDQRHNTYDHSTTSIQRYAQLTTSRLVNEVNRMAVIDVFRQQHARMLDSNASKLDGAA